MCSRVRVGEVSFDYRKGPSFSSTLLEHIYRSIDGDDGDGEEYHRAGMRKQEEKDVRDDAAAHRAKLLDKWMMEKKIKNVDVQNSRQRPVAAAVASKSNRNAEPLIDKKLHYIDNDPLFFSSGSNSSDSNSSLFSDHDPIPVVLPTTKTRSSCFLPPKPIRTKENKKNKSTGAKTEQHHCCETEQDEDAPASTKSRTLKMYSHLKKMKQPISPGVKLTAFINSIFSKSNTKNNSNRGDTASAAVKPTCSSASSSTRTYMTTTAPSSNYSVKLAPVNVKIKTDDPEPQLLSVKRASLAKEQDLRVRPQLNRASNSKATGKISVGRVSEDAASDCSEDLFELDHLKLSNINANGGDLPVFETTRISSSSNRSHKNRVIVLKHSES